MPQVTFSTTARPTSPPGYGFGLSDYYNFDLPIVSFTIDTDDDAYEITILMQNLEHVALTYILNMAANNYEINFRPIGLFCDDRLYGEQLSEFQNSETLIWKNCTLNYKEATDTPGEYKLNFRCPRATKSRKKNQPSLISIPRATHKKNQLILADE
jgi:hypothetical protein